MATKKYNHHHKYFKLKHAKIYRCLVPGCPHQITGGYALLVGRSAECPYCGTIYVITYSTSRLAKLHCGKCTKSGKPLEQTMGELEPINVAPLEVEDPFETLLKEKNIK